MHKFEIFFCFNFLENCWKVCLKKCSKYLVQWFLNSVPRDRSTNWATAKNAESTLTFSWAEASTTGIFKCLSSFRLINRSSSRTSISLAVSQNNWIYAKKRHKKNHEFRQIFILKIFLFKEMGKFHYYDSLKFGVTYCNNS